MNKHEISARQKIFGRLASEVAVLLRGKNKPEFYPHLQPQEKVTVSDLKQIIFSGQKLAQKKYYHYSGYPGGLKTRFFKEEFKKNPAKVFRQAVYRMLPKNKQRDQIIKNLTFK